MFLSCANYGFCHLNLAGITKFKYERKNEKDSGRSSKMTPSCKWPNGPCCLKPLFQSEALCADTDMKMIFNYDANKTHFHKKGFAISLVLKASVFGTRKWPIIVSLDEL